MIIIIIIIIVVIIIVVVVVERVAQTKVATTPPNLQLHYATQSLSLIKFTTFKIFCDRPSLNRLPDACHQRNGANACERRQNNNVCRRVVSVGGDESTGLLHV